MMKSKVEMKNGIEVQARSKRRIRSRSGIWIDGQPRRSYRADPQLPIVSVSDLARIPSGPHAGDLGAVTSEPGEFLRLVLE